MSHTLREQYGTTLFIVDGEGPLLKSGTDVIELAGAAPPGDVVVVIPVARVDPAFFDLKSGVAGDIAQKLVNYSLRAAFIGDIAAHVAKSGALRDYVRESNRGRHIWFLESITALEARLLPA